MNTTEMVEMENVNTPGRTSRVNAEKYGAIRDVLLSVLPGSPPGLSQAELGKAVLPYLPLELWPDGAKSMWWVKTVQLDLEAKDLIDRTRAGGLTHWYRL